jgi:hypothetical protein
MLTFLLKPIDFKMWPSWFCIFFRHSTYLILYQYPRSLPLMPFILSSEMGYYLSNVSLLLKIIWFILGLLHFRINFRIHLSIFISKHSGNLVALSLWVSLRRVAVLITLTVWSIKMTHISTYIDLLTLSQIYFYLFSNVKV